MDDEARLIPRIAAADPSIAGLIVMAGAARPLEQAIVEQMEYLAMADGTVSSHERKGIDEARQAADAIRALTPADAAMHKGRPARCGLVLAGWTCASTTVPDAAARRRS